MDSSRDPLIPPANDPHTTARPDPATAGDRDLSASGVEASGETARWLPPAVNHSAAALGDADFRGAAKSIFDLCKRLTGASAGYIALLSADGQTNEVLCLDSGGAVCTVDPSKPMPIRGLRERAYATGLPVLHNDFAGSEWVEFMPEGHSPLHNVMFAPLVMDGSVVGLIGLANKLGGFVDEDAEIAGSFAGLIAAALSWSTASHGPQADDA